LITEAPKVIQPPLSARTSVRTFSSQPDGDHPYTDPELRKIFDRMLDDKKCPPLAVIQPLRYWITCEMAAAIEKSDYEFGEKLAAGRVLLQSFFSVEDSGNGKEARRKVAKERYKNARENLAQTQNEWSEKIAVVKSAHEHRIAELEAQHESEVAEFEQRWADPEYVSQFYRPSPRLLLMRATERKLAIFQDFREALLIKNNADRLEQHEVKEARRRAVATMKLQYDNLEAKQQRELDCMMDHANRMLEVCEKDRERGVRSIQKVVERLADSIGARPKRGKKGADCSAHAPLAPVFELPSARARRQIRVIRGPV
jgi:hypothetical protein